jgi:hypothetical protein
MRQWRSSNADRSWMLDFNHTEFMGIENAVLQPDTTSVYKVNVLGRMIDPKRLPFLVYAGPNLLRDKSDPRIGDTLKDSDPWTFCFAYRAGECRASSAAGDFYAVVPSAAPMNNAACPESEYSRNTLCALSGQATVAFVKQHAVTRPDPLGHWQRRLTMGFSGPGRQSVFANARSTPDGKWAIVPGYGLDGLRHEMLLVKLPPLPESLPDRPGTFRPVPVNVPALPGAKEVLLDFGYAEYGAAGDFFCTPRAETCSITTPALDEATPFRFEHEVEGAIPCESGCSVELPGLPGKIIYYRIRFLDGATLIHKTRASALAVP